MYLRYDIQLESDSDKIIIARKYSFMAYYLVLITSLTLITLPKVPSPNVAKTLSVNK